MLCVINDSFGNVYTHASEIHDSFGNVNTHASEIVHHLDMDVSIMNK